MVLNTVNLSLKENQIVCLEHNDNYLYGEVIQLIAIRKLCWFRPLCLVIDTNGEDSIQSSSSCHDLELNSLISEQKSVAKTKLIDLRSGSDLLWPESLFRPAIDTEIIHFLSQLEDINLNPENKKLGRRYLNKFIHLVWQAHLDKF